jgi:predicted transcriptional regulator
MIVARTATAYAFFRTSFTINLSAENAAPADRLARTGDRSVMSELARAYARRAIRHRFKRQRDQLAETIGE